MNQVRVKTLLLLLMDLSGNEQKKVVQLAKKYDTTTRTIYRYLKTFEDAGLSVHKISPGVYSLATPGDETVNLGNLVMFSPEEASVVKDLVARLDSTNPLKRTLEKKLSAVAGSRKIADIIVNRATSCQVEMLDEAMERHRKVILRGYESGNTGTVSDRLVEPFRFTTNLEDVLAYEPAAGKVKTFKINRIREVEVLDDKWDHPLAHHNEYQDAFRMAGERRYHVKLELNLKAKNLLQEEFPMVSADIHRTSTGRWILDTHVSRMEGVARFVLGLAAEIRIIEAPDLVDYISAYRKSIDRLVGM